MSTGCLAWRKLDEIRAQKNRLSEVSLALAVNGLSQRVQAPLSLRLGLLICHTFMVPRLGVFSQPKRAVD